MRMLILGGTAFFGKDIVRAYRSAGFEVTVFTRGNARPGDLPPHQHITGDRTRIEDLQKAAGQGPWDVVIDNIAYCAEDVRNAVAAFRGAGRYVLMSTVSVYRFVARRYPQPFREDYVDYDARPAEEVPHDVHWKYARGKLEAEAVLAGERAVPWTILRPPVVYGPFDFTNRGFWYLIRILEGGPVLLSDGGNNSFGLVFSRDVAQACLDCVRTERTVHRTYNLAQEEVITLGDFVRESARALDREVECLSLPGDLLRRLGELGGPHAPMVNLIQDISAARRDFGFAPTPWEDFARESALWFRDHWKGNRDELLGTREKELQLADKWKRWASQLS